MTPDTTSDLAGHLHTLYRAPSKHNAYQSVPDFVADSLNYREEIDDSWRGDHCRLAYLLKVWPLERLRTLTDIGANTGFFALSLAHRFPSLHVTACEPDRTHATFIRTIASTFRLTNVDVIPKGVTLRSLSGFREQDAALLLNVLHHAGYDFEPSLPRTREAFDDYAKRFLGRLARTRRHLFFQMGSNWGGDKLNPLVPRDAHVDKLRYMAGLLTHGGWQIRRVAYPTRLDSVVTYLDLPETITASLNCATAPSSDEQIARAIADYDLDQFPGEFYKRPLFVCESDAPNA
jgi:hypothetical protein